MGADEVVDYTAVEPAEVLSGFDVVIELIGGETSLKLLRILRSGGLLVSAQAAWAPNLQAEAERLGVRASWYLLEPDGEGLEAPAGLVADGRLRLHVQTAFPLEAAWGLPLLS
jgi:NADPH:quinone reductase-like Zn-dependent oxidoreductase